MEIAMILHDTIRSRAYLQFLLKEKIIPSFVLFINELNIFGKADIIKKDIDKYKFDPNISVLSILNENNIIYKVININELYSKEIIKLIENRSEDIFVFSCKGGMILKKRILNTGKYFLHIHPGKIPEYKGSTVIYYSILKEKKCFASAFFLNNKIDSGKLLMIKEYNLPDNNEEIDYLFDPFIRSNLLIEVLKKIERKDLKIITVDHRKEKKYYIIHPFLKHLAILKK